MNDFMGVLFCTCADVSTESLPRDLLSQRVRALVISVDTVRAPPFILLRFSLVGLKKNKTTIF